MRTLFVSISASCKHSPVRTRRHAGAGGRRQAEKRALIILFSPLLLHSISFLIVLRQKISDKIQGKSAKTSLTSVWGKQNSRAQTEEFFTREREKIQSIWKFYYTRTSIGYVVKYVASDNCFCEKREKFLRLAMPTNLPHEFIHWELCQIQSTKNRRLSSSVRKYRVTYRLGT